MAVYNEIGIGRWNRFIQKLTDMKGGPPARQLSSEIQFQHDIFSGKENHYLQGWDRFGVGLIVGGIVGQPSAFRITNPSNSNVIAVIEKAVASVGAASFLVLEYGTVGTTLSNLAVSIPMETRGRTAATSLASFNAGVPTTLSVVAQVGLIANSPYEFIQTEGHEISVPPGSAVQIDTSIGLNIQMAVSFWWRERFLEPSERK